MLDVRFANERTQRVSVSDAGDRYELSSIVARPAAVAEVPDAAMRAWRRNRSTHLVGFRIDKRGRLVGEAWAPKVGLTAAEFRFHVRQIARESDRFEFVLTGRDVE